MDFTIPDDLRRLKEAIHDFVAREVIPREREIEEQERVPDDLLAKMRAMGLFGITIPQEYGGLGVGPLGYALASEEIGRAHAAVRALIGINNGIGSQALVLRGTEEQKRRYLPRLASGEFVAAFALSEPGAGSDAAAITTRAVRRGERWLVSGTKHFITNGPFADVVTVMAVTDPGRRAHGGITAFLVEKGTPGFRVGRVQETMGSRGCLRSELVFDDCVVPDDKVIGGVGEGFELAMRCLEDGRISYAAFCVGLAARLLEMSRDWAKARVQFGRPIAEFQAIQLLLAEAATAIEAARALTLVAAWKRECGEQCAKEASMAKLFASEAAGKAADSAVQIHGAMGYAKDLPVERLYRDARLFRIAEGTSEIQKLLIARKVLEGS